MSDFESFRREAGSRVMPPDFDELVATSHDVAVPLLPRPSLRWQPW